MPDQEILTPLAQPRPGAGSTSARGILLTVLGSFVLPNGGTAWTSTLIAALATVGIEERAARQAISRSAASGWLVKHKHGRRARWQLSERAERVLREGAGRIYSFGTEERAWDGQWLVLFASVPEVHRDLRYRLRVQLNWAGFGSLSPGVWLSPWADREPEAQAVIVDLGPPLEARSFVARHGSIGEPEELVSAAWDLQELERSYGRFLDDHADRRPPTDADAAGSVISLVHEWRHFPAVDPGLPDELLPHDWPGRPAARVFTARHEDWLPLAQRWWRQLEEAESGGSPERPVGPKVPTDDRSR